MQDNNFKNKETNSETNKGKDIETSNNKTTVEVKTPIVKTEMGSFSPSKMPPTGASSPWLHS